MVECPKCGHRFSVGRLGTGTKSMAKAMRLTPNDLYLLTMFVAGTFKYPPTVREVQSKIYARQDDRPIGVKENWNYHDVQMRLSRLVGCHVLMLSNDPSVWLANEETMSWTIDKKPRYWPAVRKERTLEIIANKGKL